MFLKKIKVAVHDGSFHGDDVFAVAILKLYLKKPLKIFRTRDTKILSKMDYILDVGREYNPKERKFDHHQENWNEKRENGVLYASCGLLWKEFGEKITGSKDVAEIVDQKIIQTIDSEDNGISIYEKTDSGLSPFCFSDFIYGMNPTYAEKKENVDKLFKKAVGEVRMTLKREIKRAQDYTDSVSKMKEIYDKTKDKRIIVLDKEYSWKRFFAEYPEPLFVIEPIFNKQGVCHVSAVNIKGEKFKKKMDFPKSWAGKVGEELQKLSGVHDAIFCHNKRFMASVGSKEGAIKLAELAISLKSKV
jgi:uncharacterized UPF0160 family protein